MYLKTITPKNIQQQRYIHLLEQPRPYVVIASGSAGSGKTMLATHIGVKKLQEGVVDKLVITRPAVSVDESHGFLPGTLEEKLSPWNRPIYDVLQLHYPKAKVDKMIKDGVVELCGLGFLRGRTFNNSWIILDEAQNCSCSQTLTMLTRIGENSKLVITGDLDQTDIRYESNGLKDLIEKIEYHKPEPDIEHIAFTDKDIQRHPVIPVILNMYK